MHTLALGQAYQWLQRKVSPLVDNLKHMLQKCKLHANLASFLSFTKEWEEEEPPDTQENVDTEEREEVESALVGEIVEDEEVDTTQEVENQSGKTSITIDTTIIYYYN